MGMVCGYSSRHSKRYSHGWLTSVDDFLSLVGWWHSCSCLYRGLSLIWLSEG